MMDYTISVRMALLTLISVSLLAAGCGTVSNPSSDKIHVSTQTPIVKVVLPEFQNELNIDKVSIRSTYQPTIVKSQSFFEHINVIDSNGNSVILDAQQRPIFFTAYWCPHCQRTLVEWQANGVDWSNIDIVEYGFPVGTPLNQAKQRANAEIHQYGLKMQHVYYYFGPATQVTGIPFLAFEQNHNIVSIYGEFQWQTWKTALEHT